MPQPSWSTVQECVHRLEEGVDDPERGLRFCFGHEANTREGVFLTWPQVARRVRGVACRIAEQGVRGGEVVLIHSHDQQTAWIALLACIHLGLVPSAVAPLGRGSPGRLIDQLGHILALAEPRLLICDRPLDEELSESVQTIAPLPPTLVLDAILEADTAPVLQEAAPHDLAFLQFTSGSASAPKGVEVRHEMLLANLADIHTATGWHAGGRLLCWLPIYHDMSLVGLYFGCLLHRSRGCFFPTARFGRNPHLWMELMAEERASATAGPNFAFAMVNRLAERRPVTCGDLSAADSIICGSEPIDPSVLRRFAELHEPHGLRDGIMPAYGMAECVLYATGRERRTPLRSQKVARAALAEGRAVVVPPAEDGVELVACGQTRDHVELAIAHADGTRAQAGEVGEICLRGASVLANYFRQPDLFAASQRLVDGREWFATGDLGFVLEEDLFICGRAKEVIIHNGVNYYPADIEQDIQRRFADRVRLCAVVDPRRDLNAAFPGLGVLYTLADRRCDRATLDDELRSAIQHRTGLPIWHLLGLEQDSLPRTTSGKLVRNAIRERLWSDADQ